MRKNKFSKTLTVFLIAVMAAFSVSLSNFKTAKAEINFTVSPAEKYQEIDGWGSSLIWWAGMAGGWDWEGASGEAVREEIMQLIFGEDGLEYNIARYNVGGGDDPDCAHNLADGSTHMRRGGDIEGYKTYEDGDYNWDADANQRWTLDWVNKNVENAVIEYFSNSAPWWMTKTGCVSGNGTRNNPLDNLKDGYESAFAQYFVDVLEHLIEVDGIKISSIQPFNESSSEWWNPGGGQEGMMLTDAQRSKILLEINKLVSERGLNVSISGMDCTGPGKALSSYNNLGATDGVSGDEIRSYIDRVNYHLYEGGNINDSDRNTRAALRRRTKMDEKALWMSEMGYNMDDGLTDGMTTALTHSEHIRDTLNVTGASAYVLWQIVEELSTQLGATSNYGPVKTSYWSNEEVPALAAYGYNLGSYTVNKQYYVLGQYSKYLKAGYRLTKTSDENAVAAVSPDGKKVVIVTENKEGARTVNYTLDGYTVSKTQVIRTDANNNWGKDKAFNVSGSKVSVDLTENSVTTIVLETTPYKADRVYIDEADTKAGTDASPSASGKTVSDSKITATVQKDDLDKSDRFYYRAATIQNNSNAKNFDTMRIGTNNNASLKFTGKGIALSAMPNATTTTVDVYIDGVKSGGTITLAKSGSSPYNFFEISGLDEGEHIIRFVKTSGSNFDFDGAYIQKDDDATPHISDMPDVTYARAYNGKIGVEFTAYEQGGYVMEYRKTTESEFTAVEIAAGNYDALSGKFKFSRIIDGLDIAGSYILRIKYGENKYTTETVLVMNTPSAANTLPLYYVDTGAPTKIYSASDIITQNNSAKDSAFHLDILTGKSWGRTSENNESYLYGKTGSPGEAVLNTLSADGDAQDRIAYKFEVGKEVATYDIVIGAVDHWKSRTAEITVNGNLYAKTFLIDGSGSNQMYPNMSYMFLTDLSADVDGFIEIVITAESGSDNPLIGTILVADSASPVAAVVSAYGTEDLIGTDGAKRIESLDFSFGKVMEYDYYAYMSNGIVQKIAKENVTGSSVIMNSTGVSSNAGAILGVYNGVAFGTGFNIVREGVQTYYFIDCGSDGSTNKSVAAPPTIGTKQGGSWDQPSTNTSTWGYIETNTKTAWADGKELYTTSSRHVDGDQKYIRYRLTGLTVNSTVKVTVGAHSLWGWGTRAFDVYFADDLGGAISETTFNTTQTNRGFVGELNLSSSGMPKNISKVMPVTASTMYIMAYNKASSQHPQLSYIIVEDDSSMGTAINAPRVNKTEAIRTDVITVSDLISGANVIITDNKGLVLESFIATSSNYSLDLSKYNIASSQLIKIVQQSFNPYAGSAAAQILLPGVIAAGIKEEWSGRNVLTFLPTLGVQISRLTVTDENNVTTDITYNEYFYYRAYENGEYTVTLTTKSGNIYTSKISLDKIDLITLNAVRSTSGWTNGNVNISFTPKATSGIAQVIINGELVSLNQDGSYSYSVTENASYTIKLVSVQNVEQTFVLDITNIDKVSPTLEILPDYTFMAGFKAELKATALSGGSFEILKGGSKYAVDANTLYLMEKGEYTIGFINNAGSAVYKTLTLTYDIGESVLSDITLAENKLTVLAKNGTNVYILKNNGGTAFNAEDGVYDLPAGSYMLYAETASVIEAVIINVSAGADEPERRGCGKGCASIGDGGSIGGILVAGLFVTLSAFLILYLFGKKSKEARA